jgi:hypothetical protein
MKTRGLRSWAAVAVAAILCASLLAGCNLEIQPINIPAEQLTPSYVGIITATLSGSGATGGTFNMKDGTHQTVDLSVRRQIDVGLRGLVGDLLLLGDGPGQPWVDELTPWPGTAGCWGLTGSGIDDSDGYIRTTAGLRLKKAPDFVGSKSGSGYYAIPGHFCVSEQGLLTSQD